MAISTAVIGAGYGDEGKGLVTDFFARKFIKDGRAPLVARCNGGAQAGHTVVDGEKCHVFGHIGAGTFAGSDTYLGSQFIINPLTFEREMGDMKNFGLRPDVYASPSCRITTIYDMALNSLAELARSQRHGSCGMGINETVARHRSGFFLTLEMLDDVDITWITLKRIRKEWVPVRLKELGIIFDDASDAVKAQAKIYFEMFDLDMFNMAVELKKHSRAIQIKDPKIFNPHCNSMIIEGAQGLMIDEFLGEFPYVTRSVTGLPSAITTAYECGYSTVQPVYVTRAYTTRHGAGPLEYEGEVITDKKLYDYTNLDNKWQGAIRFAPLNLDRLQVFINADLARGLVTAQLTGSEIDIPTMHISCMDQLGDTVNIVMNGKLHTIETRRLIETVEDHLNIMVMHTSYGPTASYVQETVPRTFVTPLQSNNQSSSYFTQKLVAVAATN